MAGENSSGIELADMRQGLLETANDRRRFGRKKDRVTIADDHFGVEFEVGSDGSPSPSHHHISSSAAVFDMAGPSIADVIRPTLSGEHKSASDRQFSVPAHRNSIFDTSPSANAKSNANKHRTGGSGLKHDSFDDDGSEQRTEETEDHSEPRQTKKIIISFVIAAFITGSWTGSAQFAKSSLSTTKTFNAPYFLVWFSTNWMTVCFPFYVFLMIIVLTCFRRKLNHVKSPYRIICDASLVFGPSGITLKAILTRSISFTGLWIVANYAYTQALTHLSVTEATLVFSSNLAFVYLLSWIFLHDAFVALRILAMLLAIVGIVLLVHADGLGSMSFVGIVCAVVAATVTAVYKVLFKKMIGDANFGQISLFMSILGLCNLLMSWPIALLLIMTNGESILWDMVPWSYICASAAFSLLFNLLVNVGVAYTNSVYIYFGLFLGLPLNAVVDAVLRKETLKDLQIVGGICLLASFLILMLPEDFASSVSRWMGISRHHRDVYIARPEVASCMIRR